MTEKAQKVKLLKPFDADKISVEKDRYFSDAFRIDLPLETQPDHIWLDIFEHEWRSSRHLWDRKLFVIGDKVRLLTTDQDFKEKLEWIDRIVDQTNKYVEDFNRSVNMAKQQQKDKTTWEERARIQRIRETLRTIFAPI